jgi:fatty acid/phospholipid synthesis protein PlsX
MRVAVDVMGTDRGPAPIVAGAIAAARKHSCTVVLVGDESEIRMLVEKEMNCPPNIEIHHASQVVEMCESPSEALRKKKDSSVAVASRLVKEKYCEVAICPGSTGAAVASALLIIGRIPGVDRAAIATPIPNLTGTTVLMDSGANVDSKPRHLVQAAVMGSWYAKLILGVEEPRVGLLNVGEEESKGNEQTKATFPLLKKRTDIHFVGNVEGRDLNNGEVDVMICDGFVGNIALKLSEGLASAMLQFLRAAVMEAGIIAKLGAVLLKPAVRILKKRVDPSVYGGAPLLGVNGGFIICHGSSDAVAIENAVRVAVDFAQKDVVNRIRESLEREGIEENDKD